MMQHAKLSVLFCLVACLAVSLAVGCSCRGRREFTDHSRDAEAYARRVKVLILTQLPLAKAAKDEPESYTASIVNELQNYTSNPVGSHGDTYAQLLQQCKELHEMLERGGDRKPANQKIDEIIEIANQLPGTVQVDRQD
jgi:hypothetical protein